MVRFRLVIRLIFHYHLETLSDRFCLAYLSLSRAELAAERRDTPGRKAQLKRCSRMARVMWA